MNGHDPSSQTVFSPRQSSLTHPYSSANGHIVSSRTPALRAASAEPSAVRPGGLRDSRDSFAQTTGVSRGVSVDGERAAKPRWQDNGALDRAPQGTPQPAPVTKSERRSLVDTGSVRSQNSTDDLKRSARLTLWVRPGVKTALRVSPMMTTSVCPKLPRKVLKSLPAPQSMTRKRPCLNPGCKR